MSAPRVCLDATPLLLRSAGVKNYVYYWLLHLLETAGERTISVFPYLKNASSLTHEESSEGCFGTLWRLALLHFANLRANPLLDWLPFQADLFHASHQLRNPPRKTKLTATLFDFTCWRMPETHGRPNVRATIWFAEHVMRRADGLIAISEATRRDAIELLGLHPDKIRTIYPGVAPAFFSAGPAEVAQARNAYQAERPYILFVGTIEPRKSVETALDAYEGLPREIKNEFDFLVAGPSGWHNESTLARLHAGQGGVRYLGYVPEEHLPGLTAGAAVFVYPSLFEGFGFPVAQALAAGVPVVTTNISSLPEVAQQGALLIEPRSVSQCRDALLRLLTSPSLRQRLAAEGRLLAKRYRWEDSARATWKFFDELLGYQSSPDNGRIPLSQASG